MIYRKIEKVAQVGAFCLALFAASVSAQTVQQPPSTTGRQAFQAQLAAHEEAVARAAAVFLDASRSVQERAAAANGVDAFFRRDQAAAAVRLARDPSQPPQLRALALRRVVHLILEDDTLITDLLRWVASPEAPAELHRAAVDVAEALMFSSLASHARRGEFLEAFRALTRDPDPDLRRRAFALLSGQADDSAQRQLLEGLKSPDRAAVPPAEAIRLLGLRLPADAYPVFRAFLFHSRDAETRLEAIRHLGGHPPSQPDLIRILQNPEEAPEARLAALGALYANVPESLPEIVLPVIRDERAGDELRVQALQSVRWRRRSSALRLQGISVFDAAVRDLAHGSRSEAVRRVALEYLDTAGVAKEPQS